MIKKQNLPSRPAEAQAMLSHGSKGQLPPKTPSTRNYTKVTLPPSGIPFHDWNNEKTIECHLDSTDYKLGNGDAVNKVTRTDNAKEELIGVNIKLQQYFDEFGIGNYIITRLDKVKSKNTGRSYYDYEVEFCAE